MTRLVQLLGYPVARFIGPSGFARELVDRALGGRGLRVEIEPFDEPRPAMMRLPDLLRDFAPARARKHPAWTWADEDANCRTRMCLCCGRPGHYLALLEQHIAANGMDRLGVYLDDGYIGDGHHRVLAARALGIDYVPVESKEDARKRWVRDHGYVDWEHRQFGDV